MTAPDLPLDANYLEGTAVSTIWTPHGPVRVSHAAQELSDALLRAALTEWQGQGGSLERAAS